MKSSSKLFGAERRLQVSTCDRYCLTVVFCFEFGGSTNVLRGYSFVSSLVCHPLISIWSMYYNCSGVVLFTVEKFVFCVSSFAKPIKRNVIVIIAFWSGG
jgi:hypothetical protein